MKVGKISFTSTAINTQNQKEKKDFFNIFYDKVKNEADMTDAIKVPRTIFKGYLGIMTGTTLVTLGSLINKPKSLSKTLSVTGLLASLYGTWAFVRPFILIGKGVEKVGDKS